MEHTKKNTHNIDSCQFSQYRTHFRLNAIHGEKKVNEIKTNLQLYTQNLVVYAVPSCIYLKILKIKKKQDEKTPAQNPYPSIIFSSDDPAPRRHGWLILAQYSSQPLLLSRCGNLLKF